MDSINNNGRAKKNAGAGGGVEGEVEVGWRAGGGEGESRGWRAGRASRGERGADRGEKGARSESASPPHQGGREKGDADDDGLKGWFNFCKALRPLCISSDGNPGNRR